MSACTNFSTPPVRLFLPATSGFSHFSQSCYHKTLERTGQAIDHFSLSEFYSTVFH